ncbi:hypothetical protein EK904_013364, partial [Melospiza melodia maxima]
SWLQQGAQLDHTGFNCWITQEAAGSYRIQLLDHQMPVAERAGALLTACVRAANYKLFGAEILSVCRVFGTAGSLSQLAFSESSVREVH